MNYISNYLRCNLPNCDETSLFTTKVINEKEVKLREFNFKLLHGILPCNKNLKRWKLKGNDMCDVCNNQQSIEHLLFDCQYVKSLWQKVNSIFNVDISFQQILGYDSYLHVNNVITIVCFLIYKDWLLKSLVNKKRDESPNIEYFRSEIALRLKIYKSCKIVTFKQELLTQLEMLVNCM